MRSRGWALVPCSVGGAGLFLELGLGKPAVGKAALQQRHFLLPFSVGGADGQADMLRRTIGAGHTGSLEPGVLSQATDWMDGACLTSSTST